MSTNFQQKRPGAVRGFTLIEIVTTIVIISITVVSLLSVVTSNVTRSVDPMLRMQAIAIAQGYIEEALLKQFADPNEAETGSCEEGALPANRQNYDDIQDYNCISDLAGALDQFGNPLAGLGQYNVQMTVSAVTLGSGAQQAAGQQAAVTVTHDDTDLSITLTGIRTVF